jgi:hypothetical protein
MKKQKHLDSNSRLIEAGQERLRKNDEENKNLRKPEIAVIP